MGNKVCCEDDRHVSSIQDIPQVGQIKISKPQHPVHTPEVITQIIPLPELNPIIHQKLKQKQITDVFHKELENDSNYKTKKYGNDVYYGHLDEKQLKPNGFGKMYKADGSLYLGYFDHGKATGKGSYIFNNGSYFVGSFHNNVADCQKGIYKSNDVNYVGGVKNNVFHGPAEQTGKSYKFVGQYQNGHRKKGLLEWTKGQDHYRYNGNFNENNKFEGQGQLIEPKGRYQGLFLNGQKHGQGKYYSENGTKYFGNYVKGSREGFGTIYNVDDSIAYKGQMKNGIPHGKGSVFKGNKQIEALWEQGIDITQLPQKHQ